MKFKTHYKHLRKLPLHAEHWRLYRIKKASGSLPFYKMDYLQTDAHFPDYFYKPILRISRG